MSEDQKKLQEGKSDKLPKGKELEALPSGEDLALEALSQATQSKVGGKSSDEGDELAESEKMAETLNSLQNLIERHANRLETIKQELREKRNGMRNFFENDTQLNEAQDQVDQNAVQLKERKSQLQADPQITSLKVGIGELREQQKEIEETLSNHLINYHSLTNSTSFDTSDGDQWEFNIKARIKPRRKRKLDD